MDCLTAFADIQFKMVFSSFFYFALLDIPNIIDIKLFQFRIELKKWKIKRA